MVLGLRPLEDAHCEAWGPSYTHSVLISDSLNQCTKTLARPVHFSNASAALLGMGDCKSPPVTEVKLLRSSSVQDSSPPWNNDAQDVLFCVFVYECALPSIFSDISYRPAAAILSTESVVYIRYVNTGIRDSDSSECLARLCSHSRRCSVEKFGALLAGCRDFGVPLPSITFPATVLHRISPLS
jgi:hypothetical protein